MKRSEQKQRRRQRKNQKEEPAAASCDTKGEEAQEKRTETDAEASHIKRVEDSQPQPLADQIGLVGLEAVQRQLVFLGKDRDGLEAELVGGAKDANGGLDDARLTVLLGSMRYQEFTGL